MNMEELKRRLKEQVRNAVRSGQDIRENVSRITGHAAQTFHEQAEDLSGLVEAVLDGAVEGVRESPAGQADSALRQVIEGLGDAFSASAHAVQLALQEAKGSGAAFAREDLDQIVRDFRSLGELFVGTVERSLKALGSQASTQSSALSEHARNTFRQVRSHLHDAASAATQNLGALPGEALQAGTAAARQAAGTFFTLVGRHMKEAGERMSRPPSDSEAQD